jgi:hypothetical protein
MTDTPAETSAAPADASNSASAGSASAVAAGFAALLPEPSLFEQLAARHIERYASGKGIRFGITRAMLGDWFARKGPATEDELEGVTEALAREILLNRVWKPLRGDRLPEPVAAALFDVAVRRTVPEAGKLLQTAVIEAAEKRVALRVDGRLGRETMTAIDALVKAGKDIALAERIMAERTTMKFRLFDGKLFGRDIDIAGAGMIVGKALLRAKGVPIP